MWPYGRRRGRPPRSGLPSALDPRAGRRHGRSGLLYASVLVPIYIGLWVGGPLVLSRGSSDLDEFFWPAAQLSIHGHLFSAYALRGAEAYPDASGPLGFMILAPFAALSQALRLPDSPGAHLAVVGPLVAILGMALSWRAIGLARRGRGEVEWSLAAMCLFLAAPALWVSVADYGHVEQLAGVLLVFIAIEFVLDDRPASAGLLTGLAVLARTTATLYALPMSFAAAVRGGPRKSISLITSSWATVGVGIAPFALVGYAAVAHSLIGFRNNLPIGEGSFWLVLRNSPVSWLAIHADSYIALGLAAAATGIIVWRRPWTVKTPAGVTGLLAIAAGCFPMIAKTTLAYYLFEPYAFATVWWIARPASPISWRAVVPTLLTADVFLLKWGSVEGSSVSATAVGVISSAILLGVVTAISIDLWFHAPGSPDRQPCRRMRADQEEGPAGSTAPPATASMSGPSAPFRREF